jgi:hypothetical protein
MKGAPVKPCRSPLRLPGGNVVHAADIGTGPFRATIKVNGIAMIPAVHWALLQAHIAIPESGLRRRMGVNLAIQHRPSRRNS